MASSVRSAVRNPACRASDARFGEVLGLARREDQERIAREGANALERPQHDLVLARHRAARDDDRPPVGDREEAQHALRAPRRAGGAGNLQGVELQAAGDGDTVARGAELDQPAGGFLALHAEAVDKREHAPEERFARAGNGETTARRCGR